MDCYQGKINELVFTIIYEKILLNEIKVSFLNLSTANCSIKRGHISSFDICAKFKKGEYSDSSFKLDF